MSWDLEKSRNDYELEKEARKETLDCICRCYTEADVEKKRQK